jgi:hypothetical protein
LAALAFAAALAACGGDVEKRKEYWSALLKSEIPPGTSLLEAKSFFAKSGLEYSYDDRDRVILANKRDVSRGNVVSWSVHIECKFDAAERLQSCTTETFGTGR